MEFLFILFGALGLGYLLGPLLPNGLVRYLVCAFIFIVSFWALDKVNDSISFILIGMMVSCGVLIINKDK